MLFSGSRSIWRHSCSLPVSEAVCSESSSSSDSDPQSRSLPPFSMLFLELPSGVWETPNLAEKESGEKWHCWEREKLPMWMKTYTEEDTTWKMSTRLPCSGFGLGCIVYLLLFPNVLFFISIVKLTYPLFTAGLKSSRIGLCTNKWQ